MKLANVIGEEDLASTSSIAGVDLLHRESVTCRYEPGCEILGAYDGNVHIRSTMADSGEEYDPAAGYKEMPIIMSIPLDMYLEIQRTWITEKMDYCNRYGHYCGVFLGLDCLGVDLDVRLKIRNTWDEVADDYSYLEIPVYQIISFDPKSCDPEHG